MKIALVIDKSQSYLDYQRDLVIEEWGASEVENVRNFSEVGEATIFGNPPTAILHLTDIPSVKKIVEDFETAEKSGIISSKLSEGLVLTTPVARVSTKKLEALVEKFGGKVIMSKTNSKDRTNVTEKLLNETSLNNTVKKFLSEYIGDDYETLLSLLRNISALNPAQQRNLEIEDMYIRLPQSPGSVAPWEIEKPLMSGNADETIRLYRRITKHSHFLVLLSILKNKIQLSWRIAAILETSPRISMKEVSEALKVPNNYPFKLSHESAKKLGFETLNYCLRVIADTEMKVKGGSNADPNVTMEIALMKICGKLRR